LFVCEIYRELLNGFAPKFTWKTCFVTRLDEFECQGQTSRSLGTKAAFFGPFGSLCAVYLVKHLLPLVYTAVHDCWIKISR